MNILLTLTTYEVSNMMVSVSQMEKPSLLLTITQLTLRVE